MSRLSLTLCASFTALAALTGAAPARADCFGSWEGLPLLQGDRQYLSNTFIDSRGGYHLAFHCFYGHPGAFNHVTFSLYIMRRENPPDEVMKAASYGYCQKLPVGQNGMMMAGNSVIDPGWTIKVEIDPVGAGQAAAYRQAEATRLINKYRGYSTHCPARFN